MDVEVLDVKDTWRYILDEDYSAYFDELAGCYFKQQWLTVENGKIFIPKGYKWNGCNPAYRITNYALGTVLWVGTPDGPILDNGLPQTWEASMVHDALCQYREELVGVNKAMTISIFKKLLVKNGFSNWRATLYANVVKAFGPQGWK